MTEVVGLGVRGTAHSPDSDCNSNRPGSASCLSNTSSQDIDFIQDNSDYQWFLDYGYREGGNHHTSILSLPESYDVNDVGYYDTLAKNMDANLAEADMESFKTEDIHALLTNLPPMCTNHLSQENNRQGESYASVSGSMMEKFDFESSESPHSSSQGEDSANSTSMSICKSELLFSPVKEIPMPGANFSIDSLDCDLLMDHDLMLTCQANKDNYTIAFEGSVTMYSEDSDYHETDVSAASSTQWTNNMKSRVNQLKALETSMTKSDSGSFTTWSKLKKRTSENQLKRHPSGNNNSSADDTNFSLNNENSFKSQSMPNLYKQRMKGMLNNNMQSQNISDSSGDICTIKRKPVKVFDIQHHVQSSSASGGSLSSDVAFSYDGDSSRNENVANKQPNFNLVKLFMKQKSISAEGMSTTMDQSVNSDNWPQSHTDESNASDKIDHMKCTNDSLSQNIIDENNGQIVEEEEMSRSKSLEQLSESISKLESLSCENDILAEKATINNKFSVNNNNSIEQELQKCNTDELSSIKRNRQVIPAHLLSKSIQTSTICDLNKAINYKLKCNNEVQNYKIIEPSFLTKLKKEGEIQKPVYILYPNYVLPNLDFLKNADNVFLKPQKVYDSAINNKKKQFNSSDMEALKKKGFGHIHDWESLNFLLPNECRQILADVPEVAPYISNKIAYQKDKPSFCRTQRTKQKRKSFGCDNTAVLEQILDKGTNVSSSSSTATQPSSGYRGSSTMLLTDSQNSPAATNLSPLFVYRYDSVTSSEASLMSSERQRSITTTAAPPLPKRSISLSHEKMTKRDSVPPRPPLPKGILRKNLDTMKMYKNDSYLKRYSMFEMQESNQFAEKYNKRSSLQEPYYLPRNKRLSETEDEGVDAGTSSSSLDEQMETNIKNSFPPWHNSNLLFGNIDNEELAQLEEFLKLSGISSSETEDLNEEGITQLRSYVSKFLSLKINQDGNEHFGGKKTVSFAEKVNVLPKCLEGKPFLAPNNSPNVSAFVNQRPQQNKTLVDMPICEEGEISPENGSSPTHTRKTADLSQKRCLINAVTDAVEQIIHHFSPATNQSELNAFGDSALNPSCAKLVLSTLCPALYAVLSDGLKPSLETSFGTIGNSVWQVVEASAQQGPLTKALNELVMRINGEDIITEGLIKFNAFVFGLLNVRSLDAWTSYLRTRESILRKHYSSDSLFVIAHTGGTDVRSLLDTLISSLQPLALLPFHFDLLFEYRQLHLSFKRMDSYHQPPSPSHLKTSALTKMCCNKSSHSSNSHQSNSETDEVTIASGIHYHTKDNYVEHSLPDLLNSSPATKCSTERQRPRSCVEPGISTKPNFKLGEDITSIAKKRWSGISLTSKLYQAFDRLALEDEEEYTDSLETEQCGCKADDNRSNKIAHEDGPESLDSVLSDDKPLNGRRFKKLQRKWEMLSGREVSNTQTPILSPTHGIKSKIPRLVSSPNKPTGIPVPVSPTTKPPLKVNKKSTSTNYVTSNAAGRKIAGASKISAVQNIAKNSPLKKTGINTRTSRVDQLENPNDTPRHVVRPSSLPYKPVSSQGGKTKITPPRRAASSSVNRSSTKSTKTVRTLSHRMPSESGHLSYNEGERLKVVLEVDDKWLLCCRGTQKGLVLKSAVIDDSGRF